MKAQETKDAELVALAALVFSDAVETQAEGDHYPGSEIVAPRMTRKSILVDEMGQRWREKP